MEEGENRGQVSPRVHCLCCLSSLLSPLLPRRTFLKQMYNKRFGSVFRTEKNSTYFSRRLATYSNLYMSSLDSLMHYSLDYPFIPRRQSLPHEIDLNFDI